MKVPVVKDGACVRAWVCVCARFCKCPFVASYVCVCRCGCVWIAWLNTIESVHEKVYRYTATLHTHDLERDEEERTGDLIPVWRKGTLLTFVYIFAYRGTIL